MHDPVWIDRCPFCEVETRLEIRTLDDIDKRHLVECDCGKDWVWERSSKGMRMIKYRLDKLSEHGWAQDDAPFPSRLVP